MLDALCARLAGRIVLAGVVSLVSASLVSTPAVADDELALPPLNVTGPLHASDVLTDQFIVKFKEKANASSADRNEAYGRVTRDLGIPVTDVREIATGARVLQTGTALAGPEADKVLASLRADPDVEFAEPDARMYPLADPDDTYYSLQWDMFEQTGGMRMPRAWSVTKGSGVVVAVIDTGITDHSDLNANVLPGYDMISSSAIARDGDARDANPRDEGDWTLDGTCGAGTTGSYSSWHGTHVAGTVAAIANNGQGVTGVAPESRILPVRALGACGGYTSDIVDSIVWAAGGIVPGAPVNPTPARVINMSLGGNRACSTAYQTAIDFAYGAGAAVVVAAGNENRPAADSAPANCQNVITVAASGRSGSRAPYSNYGDAVDVTAPGGDMTWSAQDGIASTKNNGAYSAVAEGYFYSQGTSMAAPHVSGLAALLMAAGGSQVTPKSVEDRIKGTARVMPGSCSGGCGAGLADAANALGVPVHEIVAVATPAPVVFADPDGSAGDTYTIPSTEGVDYVVDGLVVEAGTYPGQGTLTVTAKAQAGFMLASGAQTEWAHSFDTSTADPDITGPVLASSSVSPTSFNLDDGPGTVTVSVRLTDQTGAEAPYVLLGHDASGQTQGFGALALVSGDAKDGVWERTITIPQGAATGQWKANLYPLDDTLGNTSTGFQTIGTVEVAGAPADVAGPVLASSSVSPTSFNLDDGPGTVTVSVRLTDQTGAEAPYVLLRHDASGQTQGFGAMALVSGDAKDGVWERSITIPQGAATGQWKANLYPLDDLLGNTSTGFQTLGTVDVAGTPADMTGPVLASSSVTPTSFNLNDGPATVVVSVRLTDQTGAEAPYVLLRHDASGQTQGFGALALVSGDAKDGVWERSITIPQGAATGQWKANLYPLDDVLGNTSTGFQTIGTVDVVRLNRVTPADVTFTDKDGTAEDTYTVPVTDGVEYFVGDDVVEAGTHPGSGTVTVKARATADYVLAEGAVAEWSATFKATPYVVTPAAVVFADNDGTAEDTYTVPATEGVEYLVADAVVDAGTHPGSGTVTVKARATADYVLAEGAVTEWSATFKATPYVVTPADVVFTDEDGTAEDTYTIPATDGVEYLLSETVVEAGTHPGSGTVTVKARPTADYVLAEGATAEWSFNFKATPYAVTPAAVVFTDKDGTAEDTYTVPATEGVEYLLGDAVVEAGTHPGTGTVTVRARAKADYVLAEGATAEWSATFKATPYSVTPAAVVFADKEGTAEDTYTVPATEGVEYLLGDAVVEAGTHPGVGTVTVKARAKADYVLADDAAAEWSATFKATPYSVTPAAVVFADKDGTAEDTYTVPATEGVEYLLGEAVVEAGTHPGSGTVTVKARAKADYVLAEGAAAEWSTTFKATPYSATPAAVVFVDKDGTAEDTYAVPSMEGIEYLLGDTVVEAGTHQGSGTVTVKAQAKADYVLAEGATAEWSFTFKATPYAVTPAAVVFTDKNGTAEDTYTVPATEGVEYLLGDTVVEAGTHPGSGTVTVKARAKADYVLAEGVTAEWSATFKATPYTVTPTAVVFTDKDGTDEDKYTVPTTVGVEYLVAGILTGAGDYPGTGTVTVKARAKPDYVLAEGAAAEWSATFKATPYTVTPAAVVFSDKDGTSEDTYTVPSTDGVDYLVGDHVVEAGTHAGTGTVTVTARAKPDYVLAEGAAAEWTATFKTTAAAYEPPATSPFADVSTGQQFYKEMAWLAERKISTGWTEGDGSRSYRALQPISRDAMAAFLYRMAGSPAYTPPAASPFADVLTGQQFYKEMAWLAEQRISTGWTEADGSRTYRPLQPISRDAMAAFLYRMAGSPSYTPPAVSPFADVSTGQQFYREMSWLAKNGISTGGTGVGGARSYRPLQPISRDAMAAFLFRLDSLLR